MRLVYDQSHLSFFALNSFHTMIITIGGSVGSGKSTLAVELSRKINFKRLSAGEIMRRMAAEKGLNIMEFSKYAEEHPEVDKEIDERQRQIASKGDYVVDGRLSAYVLKPDFSVWLTAPLEVRAQRIMGRGERFPSIEDACKVITDREASEHKRYKEFYGIDLSDLAVYDLVLNTGKFNIFEMTDLTYMVVTKFLSKKKNG